MVQKYESKPKGNVKVVMEESEGLIEEPQKFLRGDQVLLAEMKGPEP
jgi:hypothetical protein